MAKTIDIELQKQLDKPQVWFCKYFPARIRNVSERALSNLFVCPSILEIKD